MHEVGIISQAVDIAIESARQAGASRVAAMRIRVGALSGVAPDALRFGFDIATEGTCAEGAVLDIELVPARCRCAYGCGEFSPGGSIYACPSCGELSSDLLQGRELDLASIEVCD
jgi:hydrogenase nickel incorporation protein HypA/HybF